MTMVLACVDGSSYTNSVCDHAALFAGRMEARVRVLHVDEAEPASPALAAPGPLVDDAVHRLLEEGVVDPDGVRAGGDLVETAASMAPDLIVMGKRGADSERDRRILGSSVEGMIRGTAVPICLASRLFMAPARALVLLDADLSHRAAVDFATAHAGLWGLDADLVVVARPGEDPEPKLQWARAALAAHQPAVFSIDAPDLDTAMSRYRQSRSADLIVISRPVLLPDLGRRLRAIEEHGLWGWRTPVLVC